MASSFYSEIAASGVIKDTPGSLKMFVVSNASGTQLYFQVFNTEDVPNDGEVPFLSVPVRPAGGIGIDFVRGWAFDTGISWAMSTEKDELAADTGAVSIIAEYV